MKTGNKLPPEYLATVPCKSYARRLIWWLFRRYCLNEDRYAVTRRFTGPRPRGTNQVSTLKVNATSYRYYIEPRATVLAAQRLHAEKLQRRYLRAVA